ncbi:MAG: DUF86 domain-containing protein [Nitrospirae bacterium]|nr:MAG: DUF86 domain-containing protein [Nitrospirota bacterium]
MVIANLNIKLIEDRLGFIVRSIAKLKTLASLPEDDFLKNDNPAIAESYLRRGLEAIFDVGRHIIAKTAGKAVVEYKEIARELGKRGVISEGCAEKLILMAGYRNRLVHFYHEVENEELYEILRENLKDIELFRDEITRFVKAYRKINH